MTSKAIKTLVFSSLVSITCLSNTANAALINSDYISANDKLTVVDTETNLEWLDLSLTSGLTLEEANVQFSDYRLPTSDEFFALFDGFFDGWQLNPSDDTRSIYQEDILFDKVEQWYDLFGLTTDPTPHLSISYGWVYDNDKLSSIGVSSLKGLSYQPDQATIYGRDSWNWGSGSVSFSDTGVYLVRDMQIPEPNSLLLITISLLCLLKRKANKNL